MNNYICHHGVKGMKWGVRKDRFNSTVRMVKSNASNSYSTIIKQPANIKLVKERGGLTERDAKTCIRLANYKYSQAALREPKITNDVIYAVSGTGSSMYGLQFRLKQPTSMAGKIGSDAKEKGISFKKASDGIRDSIRYTAISDRKNFVNNYNSINTTLQTMGYTQTKLKNYFDLYSKGEAKHKSVQATYADKTGFEFELQFQTPASQAAKELKLPLYEERRSAGISKERSAILETKMTELAEKVKNPKNVLSIR